MIKPAQAGGRTRRPIHHEWDAPIETTDMLPYTEVVRSLIHQGFDANAVETAVKEAVVELS